MHGRLRAVAEITLWTLVALALLDVGIQVVFRAPAGSRRSPASSLVQYFDYGRSIDGKLARLVGPTDALSAPIVTAGWIGRDCHPHPLPSMGRMGVTVYGMSFSDHMADQLEKLDPALEITRYAGPGAPLNHSFACFRSVNASSADPNPVQIIGVLASSVSRLLTLGGLTTSFEAPQPFSYPRYRLLEGKLVAESPVVQSPDDLRDPAKMASYRAQLAADDAFYDPWQMSYSWADHSVLLRMLRRGYAQSESSRRKAQLVNDGKGFVANPQLGPPLVAMLLQFGTVVRAHGHMPIVVLFQDRGTGTDSLYRLVAPALNQAGIAVVSSHTIASVADPKNFIPDGHFTPEVDRLIAERTLQVIRQSAK